MENINVLVIEDSKNDALLTMTKLKQSGLKLQKVLMATTLRDALRIIQAEPVGVILLDLDLPDTQGLQTLKRLKPHYSGSIIVLTGMANEHLGVDALRTGADDYLEKGKATPRALRASVEFAKSRHDLRSAIGQANEKLNTLIGVR